MSPAKVGALSSASCALCIAAYVEGAILYGGHKGFALVQANALSPSSIVEFAVGEVS